MSPKNNKAHKIKSSSNQLTEFILYRNSTLPQIIVNLVKKDKYSESINILRQILSFDENRKNNMLIEFKVRAPDNKRNADVISFPTFYMRCSDLYIVGYKHEESIMLFRDSDLDYSPGIREYNFGNVYTSSSVRSSSLHAIGYTVAEAVRFPYVENKISKLIEAENYRLNIDDNLFDIEPLDYQNNNKLEEVIEEINEILSKFTVYEITHGNWGFAKENGIKTQINKLFKKLDTDFAKLNNGVKKIADFSSTTISQGNDAASEAEYFGELLGYKEDEESDEKADLEEVIESEINLSELLEEIETELYNLHNRLEQTEGKISQEENAQLWEDITEAQCEWARISAMQTLELMLKNIHLIEAVGNHLGQVGKRILDDAKIAISPNNSTNVDFLAGIYTPTIENHYSTTSSGTLTTHSYSSYNDKPDDDDKGAGKVYTEHFYKNDKVILTTNILLNYYLSWLNALPEWLQNQILDSLTVKTLIESIKRDAAIYEVKSVTEDFYNRLLYIEQEQYVNDSISEKAQIDYIDDSFSIIDMTMIFSGVFAVSYIILPMMVESASLSGKDSFFAVDNAYSCASINNAKYF